MAVWELAEREGEQGCGVVTVDGIGQWARTKRSLVAVLSDGGELSELSSHYSDGKGGVAFLIYGNSLG